MFKNKKLFAFISFFVFTLVFSTVANASASINQDGFGSSGTVVGTALGDEVEITGFQNSAFGVPGENFFGQIYDGKYIWSVGSKNTLTKFDTQTETFEPNLYYNNPSNVTMGNVNTLNSSNKFCGGIFDGVYLWLIPRDVDSIVQVDPSTGLMKGYPIAGTDMGTTDDVAQMNKFYGATYDGTNIWMAPFNSDRVVKFNVTSQQFTAYRFTGVTGVAPNNKFVGAIYSPGYVWLVPYNSDEVVRVNAIDGTMRSFPMDDGVNGNTNMGNLGGATPVQYAFEGGAYDGEYVWITPSKGNRLVRIDPDTGTMKGYLPQGAGIPTYSDSLFSGATFDGRNIWLAPDLPRFTGISSTLLLKFDTQTEQFKGYNVSSGTNVGNYGVKSAGHGAVFDGENVWMAPYSCNRMIKIEPITYTYTIEYYKDTLAPADLIATEENLSHFAENYQLTEADIINDIGGVGWKNLYIPAGYNFGQLQTPLPFTITANNENNVIKVLYKLPDPGVRSINIEYYYDTSLGEELVQTDISAIQYTVGDTIDAAVLAADANFGSNWLNKYMPGSNFLAGNIDPSTPLPFTVSSDPSTNVIKVVYDQVVKEPVYSFHVEYYLDDYTDPPILRDYPFAVGFVVGTQLNETIVTHSFGNSSWLNPSFMRPNLVPSNYNAGIVEQYPVISTDTSQNVVKVLFKNTSPFKINFYTSSVSPQNEIPGSEYLGVAVAVGTILNKQMITDYIGLDWINYYKPTPGYQPGVVVGGYPTIDDDPSKNVINIVYKKIPIDPLEYKYTIKYYKDSTSGTLLGTSTENYGHPLNTQLTQAIINTDHPGGWLDKFKPIGYQSGVVEGAYPTITANESSNIVYVVYKKTDVPTSSISPSGIVPGSSPANSNSESTTSVISDNSNTSDKNKIIFVIAMLLAACAFVFIFKNRNSKN